MLKENLQKINKEYKHLKNLEFVVYFHFNKFKCFLKSIIYPFVIFFICLFIHAYNVVEIPNLLNKGYSAYYVYPIFISISFIPLFFSISDFYLSIYSFFKWLGNKEPLHFNTYEEYSNRISKLQEEANNIILKIKKL